MTNDGIRALAAFPVLPRGARIIREFHGNDVWRDDTGQIWVRREQLVEAVQASRDIAGEIEAEADSELPLGDDESEGWAFVRGLRRAAEIARNGR